MEGKSLACLWLVGSILTGDRERGTMSKDEAAIRTKGDRIQDISVAYFWFSLSGEYPRKISGSVSVSLGASIATPKGVLVTE